MQIAVRQVGPISVQAQSAALTLNILVEAVRQRVGVSVAFANTHLLYHALRDRGLAAALKRFLILNDGVGINVAAQLACGSGFPENLNGTDFTPRLLAAAPAGSRVYLYGAAAGVNTATVQVVKARYPHLEVCGHRDGHTAAEGEARLLADMANAAPDLVLVALGNPLQEAFIARAAPLLPTVTFVGVGALFDFMTATAPRAPPWMQAASIEWLFRLRREPNRLWRRYSVELFVVAFALARARFAASARPMAR